MNQHLNEDICLDLLRGFLLAEERDQVLAHVETCASCEMLFARLAALEERTRTRGALRVQPGGEIALEPYFLGETADDGSTQAEIARRPAESAWKRYFCPALGLAAAAAALAALLLVIPQPRQDPLSAMLFPMEQLGEEVHLRSDTQTGPGGTFQAGIEAYERDELREAVVLLERAEVTGQLDNLRRIFLGSALARLGRYEEAVKRLETIQFLTVPDPWGGEARWTLYVSLRALGRTNESDSLLRELAGEPGEFGDRAREALGSD